MKLYLVRHGIAEERSEDPGFPDAERKLTKEGRARTKEVAEGLVALNVSVERIGASPLRRAKETAGIVAGVFFPPPPMETCDFLATGGQLSDLLRWLRDSGKESLMIVGHMPDLAETASRLLTVNCELDLQFKKAAVCCLVFDVAPEAGRARLEWLMQPAQLRTFANA